MSNQVYDPFEDEDDQESENGLLVEFTSDTESEVSETMEDNECHDKRDKGIGKAVDNDKEVNSSLDDHAQCVLVANYRQCLFSVHRA